MCPHMVWFASTSFAFGWIIFVFFDLLKRGRLCLICNLTITSYIVIFIKLLEWLGYNYFCDFYYVIYCYIWLPLLLHMVSILLLFIMLFSLWHLRLPFLYCCMMLLKCCYCHRCISCCLVTVFTVASVANIVSIRPVAFIVTVASTFAFPVAYVAHTVAVHTIAFTVAAVCFCYRTWPNTRPRWLVLIMQPMLCYGSGVALVWCGHGCMSSCCCFYRLLLQAASIGSFYRMCYRLQQQVAV